MMTPMIIIPISPHALKLKERWSLTLYRGREGKLRGVK